MHGGHSRADQLGHRDRVQLPSRERLAQPPDDLGRPPGGPRRRRRLAVVEEDDRACAEAALDPSCDGAGVLVGPFPPPSRPQHDLEAGPAGGDNRAPGHLPVGRPEEGRADAQALHRRQAALQVPADVASRVEKVPGMPVSMDADLVALGDDVSDERGVRSRPLAEAEERRSQARLREGVENLQRAGGVRPVVEGESDLAAAVGRATPAAEPWDRTGIRNASRPPLREDENARHEVCRRCSSRGTAGAAAGRLARSP